MNLNQELGIKGYCFRGYKDNETIAEKIKKCGVFRFPNATTTIRFEFFNSPP